MATRKWTKLESAIKLEGSSILKYENINYKKYHINTIMNPEQQKEALEKMADDYVKLDEAKYKKWKEKILQGIQEL